MYTSLFKGTIVAIQSKLNFEVYCRDAVESVYLLVIALLYFRIDVFSGRLHHILSRFGGIEFSFVMIEGGAERNFDFEHASRVPSKESQAGLLLRGNLNATYRLY